MGTLTPGDQVFDENGRPCNIVAFSEIDDTEQCYRLVFRDGSHIDAGARHLWDAQVTNNGKREKRLTTEEIYRATMRYRARHAGDERENRSVIRIPVAKTLQMPDKPLPVDPYVYGFWLGNGNAVKPEITVRTCDVETSWSSFPTRSPANGNRAAAGAGYSGSRRSSPFYCPASVRNASRPSINALPPNSAGRCCRASWTRTALSAR